MSDTKSDNTDKKNPAKPELPKFNRPNLPDFGANKFRSVFKATGRFQSINRSRR